jgi:hypothetical protein
MNSDSNRPPAESYGADSETSRVRAISRTSSWWSNILLPLLAVAVSGVVSGCFGDGGGGAPAVVPGEVSSCSAGYPPTEVRQPASTCISTLAGTGAACPSPGPGTACDGGGVASEAQFSGTSSPRGVAVDANGNVYIADEGGDRVDKVSRNGRFVTVAGTGIPCLGVNLPSTCGDGGPATSGRLDDPEGVAVDGAGNLYIATSIDNKVRKVAADGTISTVAGTGARCTTPTTGCGDGGRATAAQLSDPRGIAVDGAGNLYIADTDANKIRKVAQDGTISTIAGTGAGCFDPSATETSTISPCYGPATVATAAPLNQPLGVTVDRNGNVYVADNYADRIREVTPGGAISTVAGTGPGDAGCNVDATGHTLNCGDGNHATDSLLNQPAGVAVDQQGNLYIADTANHIVREVTPDGNISTIAGSLVLSNFTNTCQAPTTSCGDGGPATNAHLTGPAGIAVDSQGNLYIADTGDHKVRKVRRYSVTSTGNGTGPPSPTPQPPSMVSNSANFAAQVTVSWQKPFSASPGIDHYDVVEIHSDNTPGRTVASIPESRVAVWQSPRLNLCGDYRFGVSSVTPAGARSAVSIPAGQAFTQGEPSAGPPTNVVIFLNGVNTAIRGGTYDPLAPPYGYCSSVDGATEITGDRSQYCSDPPTPRKQPTGSEPLPIQDMLCNWREASGIGVGNRLTDTLASTGAVLLPFSYAGASLSGAPTAPNVSLNSYGPSDVAKTTPPEAAKILQAEIQSVLRVWPKTTITIVGHSEGGEVAYTWWQENIVQNSQSNLNQVPNVTHVWSLDSPINGFGDLQSICISIHDCTGLTHAGPALANYYKEEWWYKAQLDSAFVDRDAATGNRFTPVGTVGDPLYDAGDSFNAPGSTRIGLVSEVFVGHGCSEATYYDARDCAPIGTSVVDACGPLPDDQYGPPGYGILGDAAYHGVVKNCPSVMSQIKSSIVTHS